LKTFKQFINEMLDINDQQREVAVSNKMHSLVHMHPRKFLELTTHDDQHMSEIKGAAQSLKAYNDHTRDRHIQVAPFLHIHHTGKVIGHEGRHRAAAVLNAGHDTMPVYLHHHGDPNSDKPHRHYKFGDFPEKITGQRRGTATKSHDMKLIKDRVAKIR
jgi:hypothetical protein